MHGFEKLLILPSNGLEYNKFLYLKPLTIEYFLYTSELEESLSEIERMVNTLKKYIIFDLPITELYTDDLYFIWINFILQIIKDKYYVESKCQNQKCGHRNKISISIGDFTTTHYEGYDVYKTINIPDKEIKLKYRRRKVKDNLGFSLKNLERENAIDINQIIEYVIPQIVELSVGNQIIDKFDYRDFFNSYLQHEDIDTIFKEKFLKQDFGINTKLKYSCKKCNHENHSEIFSDFTSSRIIEERDFTSNKEELYDMLLLTSKTPVITITELLNMPYIDYDIFMSKFKDIKFQSLF